MAVSTVIKHLYDGSITLTDGTGTPLTLVVPFSTGDLSTDGLSQTLSGVVKYETRGTFNTARHNSRTYPTGSFTFQVADYSDATSQTAIDFLLKQNSYSANVSTLGANAEVYTLDLTLTIEGTDHGDSADHTMIATDCWITLAHAEGEPNTVTVSFECLGTVSWT